MNEGLNREFPRVKVYHQGCDGHIMYSPPDDANCVDHTMNMIDKLTPKALILGGISPTDLSSFRISDQSYLYSPAPQLEKIEQKTVLARKRFSHYFQH